MSNSEFSPHKHVKCKQSVNKCLYPVYKSPKNVVYSEGNFFGSTAAPITSRRHKKAGLPTHAQIPVLGDLTTDSVVLLEQIRVLDKQRLQARLGRLPYSYIQKIDKALAVSIGLWDKC